MLTTDQKGAIAEAAIAAAAVRLGIGVSRPIAPERYDLVFDVRSRLLRVQCKWAAHSGDVVIVRCRSSRRAREGFIRRDYNSDEVDAIAAYCLELDQCYFLSLDRFAGRAAIQLRLTPARNNQRRQINWASSFELAARLKDSLGP